MTSSRSFKYVILGGGNAAGYAALEFVTLGGKAGELCIVSADAELPYERPALSKGYLNPTSPARLPGFHTCVGAGAERLLQEWYDNHGITFLATTRVVAANLADKQLTTETGDIIGFEQLIIATGASSRKLTSTQTENEFYVRDIKDADALYKAIQLNTNKTAVIVGAGYIGLECAAACVKNGVRVKLVYPTAHVLPRLFPVSIATFYEKYYQQKQVELLPNRRVLRIEPHAVVLTDETQIQADMVVVGIGAVPNVELFRHQLTLEKGGIKVNGSLQTACFPNVYAIGDCAAFPLKRSGGEIVRLEHVDNARKMAAHVMHTILDASFTAEYDYLPYFYSRLFDLSWRFYGDDSGECFPFTHGSDASPGAYWVKDGHVVGAFLESGSADQFAQIQAVALTCPPAPKDLAHQGIQFLASL